MADRFAHMVDHIVDALEPRGRVDIRVGVGRRRRWSDEAKGRIVAESYAPARWCRRWRADTTCRRSICLVGARRRGPAADVAGRRGADVCPIVREARDDGVAAAVGVTVSGAITIEIAGAVVRAERGVDLGWLRDVVRAVKAAT